MITGLEANSLYSGKRVRGIGDGGKWGQFSMVLENLRQSGLTSTILRALREHLYRDHSVGRLSGSSRQTDYLLNQGYLAFHFSSLCVIPSPTFP
ncbi:hypothetical protein GYMLUDRAFT_46852 [Collybiopsis luxurians FD-317 M1]|uniref:Unplaced genomic scaffold GYMLUscaffold_46, whole genome shotgun sequence n=1 Tax=Collybiopsis luxurians FD-317 M1 TaxID=944289 RepID=A0A0D0CFV6_9AGAR|nr:hypothetical protein GYMLUDRAFT_46852 [Collybiopsis luxurians FD-317 M1]